ncbi:hypothetical protein PINS_up008388 [Pythium insidiosum]|nr:hypothetical protein PINS_up008388 [Pythium insidiosum]
MPAETRSHTLKTTTVVETDRITRSKAAVDDGSDASERRLLEVFQSQCRIELSTGDTEPQSVSPKSYKHTGRHAYNTRSKITSPDSFLEHIVTMANAVYTALGDAQTESTYQRALQLELQRRGVTCVAETSIPILYRGEQIGSRRADLIVELADADRTQCILELKAVQSLSSDNLRQLKYYMAHFHVPLGLLINFPKRQTFPDLDDEHLSSGFDVTLLQGDGPLRHSTARRTRSAAAPELHVVRNHLISPRP